jgi:transcriptional regulator with XRE-family HTH domain
MKNTPNLTDAIAAIIEKHRKSRNLSKVALADFAQLQDCYIRDIIKGRRNPTIGAIYAICEALQVAPEVFIREVEEERQRFLQQDIKI